MVVPGCTRKKVSLLKVVLKVSLEPQLIMVSYYPKPASSINAFRNIQNGRTDAFTKQVLDGG